jgi:molybdopterin/thiamine biosynthesis adenylyltransferase
MTLWWERYPERLEFELQALNTAGIPFKQVDESIRSGIYQLRVQPTVDGQTHDLLVTFPDHYPFFRFEITADSVALEHHQNPFSKALCFIGRETFYWNTTDTVAGFLTQRLHQVIEAGTTAIRNVAKTLEQPRAEPFTDYYPYAYAICHVDSSWSIPPSAVSGPLSLGALGFFVQREQPPCLQAVVLSVGDDSGSTLAAIPSPINKFRDGSAFQGRWVRLDGPPRIDNPEEVFRIAQQHDGKQQPRWATFGSHRLQVYGMLFPEETGHRVLGDGWLFVVKIERIGGKLQQKRRYAPAPQKVPPRFYFARTGRVGQADMIARSPELRPLRDRVIAHVGLGALGAPSALEFARAGIAELRLVDHDHVDPATSVRWPFGLPLAGRPKVQVISEFILQHYPYTSVHAAGWHLWGVRRDGEHEDKLLDGLVEGASLIYDATAEFGVQHFLSEFARERGVSYVSVVATPGAWGGRVLRVRPGITPGCWSCLQYAEEDGTIPRAPADERGEVDPAGCGDPTFTGANVDLLTVALHGVRLAVSTLCADSPRGYPGVDWDVAVIRLRDPLGALIAPVVDVYPLARHERCRACADRQNN